MLTQGRFFREAWRRVGCAWCGQIVMGLSSSTPASGALKAGSFGPAVCATVPPGSCVFTEEWMPATLTGRESISHDTSVLTFGLPDADKPLGLSTCACLLARGGIDGEGQPVVRPYTPISTNALNGAFQLMVKEYPEGKLSRELCQMPVGTSVDFKHIPFNVKLQYPFNKAKIGMLVGGTGISPMIQALHAVLGNPHDKTQVSILYGSRTSEDILGKAGLDEWCAAHSDQLTVTHVLSNEPASSSWSGPKGFIDRALIETHMPSPSEKDAMIFVCGPPAMYDALCGARNEETITGVLGEMGYTQDQVYKF